MFTSTIDSLAVAQQHGRELHAEAAAERFRSAPRPRRLLAAWLRRAADRLDARPLAPKPARQS